MIIPLWLKVLEDAGSDYLHSRTSNNIRNQEYMQGKGGRTLKRIVRDFAESHRNAPTSLSFMKCGELNSSAWWWRTWFVLIFGFDIYMQIFKQGKGPLVPMTWLGLGSFVFLCIASHQRAKGGASCQTRLLWTNRPEAPWTYMVNAPSQVWNLYTTVQILFRHGPWGACRNIWVYLDAGREGGEVNA